MRECLLEVLRCPQCQALLDLCSILRRKSGEVFKGSLRCKGCGKAFPIEGGFPVFAPTRSLDEEMQAVEKIGREKFAQLLLEDRLEAIGGPFLKSSIPAVSQTEVRRGGQFSSLRHGRRRLESVKADEMERLLIDKLGPPRRHRLLDLCTGGGLLFTELVKHLTSNQRIVAVDISFRALKMTQGAVNALGLLDRCDFVIGDARCLPFMGGYFDGITSNAGLDHIEGYKDAIDETVRILRPEGVLCCSGNTYRKLWGLEDLLTPEEQESILMRQGIALGKDAIAKSLQGSGLHIEDLTEQEAQWGKWYVLLAKKTS